MHTQSPWYLILAIALMLASTLHAIQSKRERNPHGYDYTVVIR